MELIVALILMFILVLGISSIDIFSHRHVIVADHRAKLQNEATFLLEHMAKNAAKAVGNNNIADQPAVNTTTVSGGYSKSLQMFIAGDSSYSYSYSTNHWIAYAFNSTIGRVDYCGNCSNSACSPNCNSAWELIASKIFGFYPSYGSTTNYIDMTVYACWDPSQSLSNCGTLDNPQINMSVRLQMPSVAAN
jgi:Tfp pilus assembly protein PilW